MRGQMADTLKGSVSFHVISSGKETGGTGSDDDLVSCETWYQTERVLGTLPQMP